MSSLLISLIYYLSFVPVFILIHWHRDYGAYDQVAHIVYGPLIWCEMQSDLMRVLSDWQMDFWDPILLLET